MNSRRRGHFRLGLQLQSALQMLKSRNAIALDGDGQQLECRRCCIFKTYEKLLIKKKKLINKRGDKNWKTVKITVTSLWPNAVGNGAWLLKALWPGGLQGYTMFLIFAVFHFILFFYKYFSFCIISLLLSACDFLMLGVCRRRVKFTGSGGIMYPPLF